MMMMMMMMMIFTVLMKTDAMWCTVRGEISAAVPSSSKKGDNGTGLASVLI